jgi:DTW domain-containing protein YfiP
MPVPTPRPLCDRCRRPASACWCRDLQPVETATRVVFLQHPREARVAIGTALIAHLGLAGSELHSGTDFTRHPRVSEIVAKPGTALLFPGPGAVAPHDLERPPATLVVIDGTWPQARKMMALNPALRALPRIGFIAPQPGNYRIRREPAPHCLATVEAVVAVLAALERDAPRFAHLLRAFEAMVDRQLAAIAARTEPPRRRHKPGDPWWTSPCLPDLEALWPRLVAVAGEANGHRRGSGVPGQPEIIHLAATRLATGETFNAFLAPRRPLAPAAPYHLQVPIECLLGGRSTPEVLEDWNRFVGPDDRLVGWGPFAWDLLAHEGWRPASKPVDLRLIAAHRLKRRPGRADAAARTLGATLGDSPPSPGRAGHTLLSLGALVTALLEEKRRAQPPGAAGPT